MLASTSLTRNTGMGEPKLFVENSGTVPSGREDTSRRAAHRSEGHVEFRSIPCECRTVLATRRKRTRRRELHSSSAFFQERGVATENGELTIVPRLTLLRFRTNKPDETQNQLRFIA